MSRRRFSPRGSNRRYPPLNDGTHRQVRSPIFAGTAKCQHVSFIASVSHFIEK